MTKIILALVVSIAAEKPMIKPQESIRWESVNWIESKEARDILEAISYTAQKDYEYHRNYMKRLIRDRPRK